MTQYESLREQLQATPFLVADGATGDVKLIAEKDALRLMADSGLFGSKVDMHVRRALENFALLTGKDERAFALRDLATNMGIPYHNAYGWLEEKIVTPSIRPASGSGRGKGPLFSWADAFIAGVCASLRRQGLRLEVLRQVSTLFDTGKKQTPRKLEPSARS